MCRVQVINIGSFESTPKSFHRVPEQTLYFRTMEEEEAVRPKRRVRNRKTIDMEQKMTLIRRFESGQRLSSISKEFGLASSTVKTILKDRDRIKGHVSGADSLRSTIITKKRAGALAETERLLTAWIKGQEGAPLTLAAIQAKARSLFEDLKSDSDGKFVASNGWFHRFKARAGIPDIKLSGPDPESCPATALFRDVVQEGDYDPSQVYGAGQTELFWRVTHGTVVRGSPMPPPHDKMVVLLCCSAGGDHKLKPLVLLHPELREVVDDMLQCRYRPDVRLSEDLWEDWFLNCFVPDVEGRCAEMGVPVKSLLVLPDGLRHLARLNDFRPGVKVVFVPPHRAPADLLLVPTFRRLLLKRVLQGAAGRTVKFRDVGELFASFQISDSVRNVSEAWASLEGSCSDAAWARLWPQHPSVIQGGGQSDDSDIVALSEALGFDLRPGDVDGFFGAAHYERLVRGGKVPDEAPTPEDEHFEASELVAAFGEISSAMARFRKMNPDRARFTKAKNAVEKGLTFYRQLFERKKGCGDPTAGPSATVQDTLVVPVHPDDVMLISSSPGCPESPKQT